ncbi:MAG: YggT family protein [Nitrospirota bacterium]|nr:YggT family protein [Nitrospirota bacterium]
MFVLGNLVKAIALVLDALLTIYFWIFFARVLLSWVNPDPYNPIVQFLRRATDPVLRQAQRILPPMGGMDFSPLLVLLGIKFLQVAVVQSLLELSMRLH